MPVLCETLCWLWCFGSLCISVVLLEKLWIISNHAILDLHVSSFFYMKCHTAISGMVSFVNILELSMQKHFLSFLYFTPCIGFVSHYIRFLFCLLLYQCVPFLSVKWSTNYWILSSLPHYIEVSCLLYWLWLCLHMPFLYLKCFVDYDSLRVYHWYWELVLVHGFPCSGRSKYYLWIMDFVTILQASLKLQPSVMFKRQCSIHYSAQVCEGTSSRIEIVWRKVHVACTFHAEKYLQTAIVSFWYLPIVDS